MSTPGDAPRSLQSVIDGSPRLDELGTARLLEQAAEAVHKAQSGQVLGTLSPRAIDVAADGSVVLALANSFAQPAYTAPERLRGGAGDRRSDVYSLGVILWEALAHARLFEGDTAAVTAAVLAGSVRAPSEQNANIPAELDAICKKALAADPADRFPSAKVMAAELGAVLEDAGYPDGNERIAAHLAAPPGDARSGGTMLPPLAAAPARSGGTMPPPISGVPAPVPVPAPPLVARAKTSSAIPPIAPRTTETTSVAPPMPTATPVVVAPAVREPTPATPMPAITRAPTPQGIAAPRSPLAQTMLGMSPLKADGAPATPQVPDAPVLPDAGAARAKTPSSLPDWATRPATPSEPPPVKEVVVASTMPGLTPVLRPPAEAAPDDPDAAGRATAVGSASLAEALARLNAAGAKDAAVPADVATAIARSESAPAASAPPSIATAETAATPAFIAAAGEPGAAAKPSVLGALRASGAQDGPPEMPAPPTAAGSMPPADDDFSPEPSRPSASAIDPAAVVALPRRARSTSKGDVLSSWEWKTDSHDAIPDDDDLAAESSRASRKRIKIAIGAAAGAIALIAIVVLAAGGGDEPAKKAASRKVSSFEPAPPIDAAVEPPVGIDAAEAVAAVEAPVVVDAAVAAVPVPVDAAVVAVAVPPDAAAAKPPEPVVAEQPAPKVAAKPPEPKVAAAKPPEPKVAAKPPEPKVAAKPPEPKAAKQPAPKVAAKSTTKVKPDKVTGKPVDPYADSGSKADANSAYRTGIQQFARGDTSGALQTFKASAAMNPDYAPTWRGMGMVYEKLGNGKSAKSAFAKYLRLSPNASDAEQIRARMEKL